MSDNLFGWSDELWRALDQWGILIGYVTFILPLLGTSYAFFKRDSIRRWFYRNSFPDFDACDVQSTSWDGIVFTVSHAETPTGVMKQLRPRHVAFVASRESLTVAEGLRKVARELNISSSLAVRSVDPDDLSQTRKAVTSLLLEMKQQGMTALAVDVTGGKTPMSLGAFMAAEEAGIASLYVASQFDTLLNKPDSRSTRVCAISVPA